MMMTTPMAGTTQCTSDRMEKAYSIQAAKSARPATIGAYKRASTPCFATLRLRHQLGPRRCVMLVLTGIPRPG